jgi:hypothetical protein
VGYCPHGRIINRRVFGPSLFLGGRMNAYEKRRRERELYQKGIRNSKLLNRLMHEDVVMRAYEAAYVALHKAVPKVVKKNGWYYVETVVSSFMCREKGLIDATRFMQGKLHEQELENE